MIGKTADDIVFPVYIKPTGDRGTLRPSGEGDRGRLLRERLRVRADADESRHDT